MAPVTQKVPSPPTTSESGADLRRDLRSLLMAAGCSPANFRAIWRRLNCGAAPASLSDAQRRLPRRWRRLLDCDSRGSPPRSRTCGNISVLARLPAQAREIIDARVEIVSSLDAFLRDRLGCRDTLLREFCQRVRASEIAPSQSCLRLVGRLSPRTLRRWRGDYRRGGLLALAPKRARRLVFECAQPRARSYIENCAEIREWLVARDLEYSTRASIAQIALGARAEFGDRAPSRAQILRFLQKFRREYRVERAFIQNPDRARGSYGAKFGTRSASASGFLDLLELDGSPVDLLTLEGRRQLIIVTDVFSRMRWVSVGPSESTDATGRLLTRVFSQVGMPKKIRTDYGAAFTSARMRAFLSELGIELESVEAPYRGDLKPFVESSVRYVQRTLGLFPGFAGHNVAHRSELRARLALKDRRGKDERDVLRVSMTSRDLEQALSEWLEKIYANQPHRGLNGRTPNQVLQKWIGAGGVVARADDEAALSAMLLPGVIRRVGGAGLRLDGALYLAPELGGFIGRPVYAVRSHDFGRVLIYTADTGERRLLCVAENSERVGARRRDIALAAKAVQRARISQARKDARALASRFDEPLGAAILRAAKEIPSPEIPAREFSNPALEQAALGARLLADAENPAPQAPSAEEVAQIDAEFAAIESRAPEFLYPTEDECDALYCAIRDGAPLPDFAAAYLERIGATARDWAENYRSCPEFQAYRRLERMAASGGCR